MTALIPFKYKNFKLIPKWNRSKFGIRKSKFVTYGLKDLWKKEYKVSLSNDEAQFVYDTLVKWKTYQLAVEQLKEENNK